MASPFSLGSPEEAWRSSPPKHTKYVAIIPPTSRYPNYTAAIDSIKTKVLSLKGKLLETIEWDPRTNLVVCLSGERTVWESERLKAAIAAGIWVTTSSYVKRSSELGYWISDPKDYAWTSLITQRRQEVYKNNVKGCLFWKTKALLLTKEEATRESYTRIIKAGQGTVSTEYQSLEALQANPPDYRQITHVILDPANDQSSQSTLPLKLLLASLGIDIKFLDTHQLDDYIMRPNRKSLPGAP